MKLMGRPRLSPAERPATSAERQRVLAQQRAAELGRLRQQRAKKVDHERKRQEWETPWPVCQDYEAECHFPLDVWATAETAKCARFFSPEVHGLVQDGQDNICWMPPPYGPALPAWMEKASRSRLAGATVVGLVPSRTGPPWWHAWVQGKGQVRERQGHLTFVGAPNPAGFASVAVIFRPPPSGGDSIAAR